MYIGGAFVRVIFIEDLFLKVVPFTFAISKFSEGQFFRLSFSGCHRPFPCLLSCVAVDAR